VVVVIVDRKTRPKISRPTLVLLLLTPTTTRTTSPPLRNLARDADAAAAEKDMKITTTKEQQDNLQSLVEAANQEAAPTLS
jgi:hypothetical protein